MLLYNTNKTERQKEEYLCSGGGGNSGETKSLVQKSGA